MAAVGDIPPAAATSRSTHAATPEIQPARASRPASRACIARASRLPRHSIHHGRCRVFAGFEAACAAAATFTSRTTLGDAILLAWVLMPDHAHFLLQLGSNDSLARVVNRIKARSAAAVNRTTGEKGALWARAYPDHALGKAKAQQTRQEEH